MSDIENVYMPPHSVEAEEAVLRVSPLLRSDDFFIVKNGWVWAALAGLHVRHEPIDFPWMPQRERSRCNGA